MNGNSIANVATALIGVAMVTTLVAHPATADVIKAATSGLSDAIRASLGK